MTGIYIHVPFCAVKCPYCDFFSVPYRRDTAEAYVQAVIRNMQSHSIDDTVDTIYFGGGTPSLLQSSQIASVLDVCRSCFRLAPDTEITMEYNPKGARQGYLQELFACGVNRLSIGTQSFSNTHLQLLGRRQSVEENLRCVAQARAAGFRNLSCDLMLAFQDETELAQTLQTLCQLDITHVSAYLLQVEEGTPLAGNAALLARLPDEDGMAERYLQTVHTLAAHGFIQYEVSSFAKEGFRSRHNQKYWQCHPYLGIGAGAHSCMDGRRFSVPKDIAAFCDALQQPEFIIDSQACGREERLMLALRTTDGVPLSELSRDAGRHVVMLERHGYVRTFADRVSLTPEGFLVSNAVIAQLIENE